MSSRGMVSAPEQKGRASQRGQSTHRKLIRRRRPLAHFRPSLGGPSCSTAPKSCAFCPARSFASALFQLSPSVTVVVGGPSGAKLSTPHSALRQHKHWPRG